MSQAMLVLLLLATSCVGATESEALPSLPQITALDPVSDECLHRPGGFNATPAGEVCPPDLPPLSGPEGFVARVGTYRTRVFAIPLEYSLTLPIRTLGEDDVSVIIAIDRTADSPRSVFALAYVDDPLPDLAQIAEHECAADAVFVEGGVSMSGVQGDVLDITAECAFNAGPTAGRVLGFAAGDRWLLHAVMTPAGGVILAVVAARSAFDQYFAEVARPIVESMRFLGS